MSAEIIGAWIAVFLTFAIFSYLYKDNPFYKIAEHIFVGVSAGYWASMFFWTQIQPNLFGRLWPSSEYNDSGFWYGLYDLLGTVTSSAVFPAGGIDKGHGMHLIYLIPFALGIMMLLSVHSKMTWFARWGIAYTVGMAAGLRAYGFLNSNVIGQIKGSAVKFSGDMPFFAMIGDSYFNSLILIVGTISGLLYFYFSREHVGLLGKVSRLGIYFLMISFGASFGFAVMGRISLLVGRFTRLIDYARVEYNYASIWMFVIMVIVLAIWAFKSKEGKEASA
ncbi:MAG: hypothetical protein HQ509_05965 [Candidatus Marinimicrobia bacterium]|nr:hypothetical protein [Candidatus Neomarinimicrobiota bacterium]